MAHLIRRGRGWYSDYSETVLLPGGKKKLVRRRRFLAEGKQEAAARLGEIVAKRWARRHSAVVRNLGWLTFKAEWLDHSRKAYDPDTFYANGYAIAKLETCFQPARVADVTPGVLERLKGELQGDGRKPATIARILGALKLAMAYAERQGYAEPQNWRAVKPPRIPKGPSTHYSLPELSRLIAESPRFLGGLLQTAVFLSGRAGLRREEILFQTWGDIDFPGSRLHVVAKDGWQPKGRKGDRWVPLPPDLAAHLRDVLPRRHARWVLALPDAPRPHKSALSHAFARLLRRLSLPGRFGRLRHTYLSHLLQNGTPTRTAAELAGHSNDRMVNEVYGHLIPETLRAGVANLPPLPGGTSLVRPPSPLSTTTPRRRNIRHRLKSRNG